jgi:hypothetical protein
MNSSVTDRLAAQNSFVRVEAPTGCQEVEAGRNFPIQMLVQLAVRIGCEEKKSRPLLLGLASDLSDVLNSEGRSAIRWRPLPDCAAQVRAILARNKLCHLTSDQITPLPLMSNWMTEFRCRGVKLHVNAKFKGLPECSLLDYFAFTSGRQRSFRV